MVIKVLQYPMGDIEILVHTSGYLKESITIEYQLQHVIWGCGEISAPRKQHHTGASPTRSVVLDGHRTREYQGDFISVYPPSGGKGNQQHKGSKKESHCYR